MEPELYDGNEIIGSPNADVTNNRIIVFRSKVNSKAGVKISKRSGTNVQLIPENPNYEVSIHDIREFAFIHRVVRSSKVM